MSSQIGFKGVITKDLQQLLERINACESERKAAKLFGFEWRCFSCLLPVWLCREEEVMSDKGYHSPLPPARSPEPALQESQ